MAEKDAKDLSVRGKIAKLSDVDKQRLDACMDEIMSDAKGEFAHCAGVETEAPASVCVEAAQG